MSGYSILILLESEMNRKRKISIPQKKKLIKRFDNLIWTQGFSQTFYISLKRDQRERRSPLTKITHSSFPHLGKSQGSTTPQCNGAASPWRNYLGDHSLPPCQVSMLELCFFKSIPKKISQQYLVSIFRILPNLATYQNNLGLFILIS